MTTDNINPNTPVNNSSNSSGEITQQSGGGPVSFDELEEVMSKPAPKKKENSSEEKGDGKKPEKRVDLTTDADKNAAKKEDKGDSSKKDEKKDSKESKDKQSEVDKPKEDTPARKRIKAKYNDEEVDFDEEATVAVQIDGKDVYVPVKELRSNYSGKVAWDKKFTEIGKMNKEIAAREGKLKESADMIRQIFDEKDPDIKMYRMAMHAGVDPTEFRQKFLADGISTLEKYYEMNEDQRKAADLEFQSKINKHRADTLEKSMKDEQSYRELKSKVEDIRARHQISEEEFSSRYEEIEEYQDKMARLHGDKYERQEVTPEFVAEAVLKKRIWDSANEVLGSLDMNDQARSQKLAQITDNAWKLGLDPASVKKMVDEAFGDGKKQRTIQKKKEQVEEFRSGKKDVSQPTTQRNDPVFFDDIE